MRYLRDEFSNFRIRIKKKSSTWIIDQVKRWKQLNQYHFWQQEKYCSYRG